VLVNKAGGRSGPNVQRVDHHYFHGWHVSLKRAGRRYERYFNDGTDRAAALQRALRWRDRMAATLPPPRKFKRRYVLNTTGVIGVHLAVQRTRKGTIVRYYCATWIDDVGRTHKQSFSVAKFGGRRARSLAVAGRKDILAELLRPRRSAANHPRRSA
jgi:hypothetical protein